MTAPRPGMDHALYAFSPIDRRPALAWPNGARLAFTVVLHLEYWELEPPDDAWSDPRFRIPFFPDNAGFSIREYGNRVGIYRVLELIERHGLKLSVPANAAALARYPNLVRRLRDLDAEFIAAGSHANRMISARMAPDAQRALIGECIAAVTGAAGAAPTGWAGPGYGESPETAGIVAELGLDYIMDWPNDDQPYLLSTAPPPVSVPRQPDWDDVEALWLRKVPDRLYPNMVGDAFERLRDEEGGNDSGGGGRYFTLSLHPWVIGQAHRIRYLAAALERIAGPDRRVWQATAGEIARAARPALLSANT